MSQTTFDVQYNVYNHVSNDRATWADSRNGVTGNGKGTSIFIMSHFYTGNYRNTRSALLFYTASVPDNDVITKVELKINVSSINLFDWASGGLHSIVVVDSTPASTSDLTCDDYNQFGSIARARQTISTTGYKIFNLATSLVNKTGWTKLGIKTSHDFDNSSPVDGSSESSFNTSGSNINLVVTHWGSDRYWVGGTGNWNDTANWSDSSGGSGGAPIPTSSNNVYFDANSFDAVSQVVTIDSTAVCLNMDWTGATNTPDIAGSSALVVYGIFTTIAAMTWSHAGFLYLYRGGVTGFTSNGITFHCKIVFSAGSDGWVLQDNLTTTSTIYLGKYGLDTNGKTVTCVDFYSSYTTVRTLTLGASTINISGSWYMQTSTNLAVSAGTSTINMTGDSTFFYGGAKTFYNVTFSGDNQTVIGSNIYTTLTLTAGKQINLESDANQTVTTLTATGSAGNLITIHGTIAGTAATITDTAGTNTCDYLSIKDITVAGGATFNPGDNSTDEGGNTGWKNDWTDAANAYSSNDTYATHTSPNGKLFVKFSKDGGTTWQEIQEVTHTGTEAEKTFGDGTTELWGTNWVGDNVYDANFRVRVYAGASDSFNWVDFYTFAFDGEIGAAKKITGIRVITEAKWDGTTTSLDHIKVAVYAGDSPIEIANGAMAHDTTNRVPVFYDTTDAAWIKLMANRGGWSIFPQTCTYVSAGTFLNSNTCYDGGFTITGNYTAVLYAGMKIMFNQTTDGTKYGYISEVSYSDPNTTVRVFLGEDYDMDNEIISSVCYSTASSPAGFPTNLSKYELETLSAGATQAAPVQNTWYNKGGNISFPVGVFEGYYEALPWINEVSGTSAYIFVTLSTANNSQSDVNWTSGFEIHGPTNNLIGGPARCTGTIINSGSGDILYLNVRTTTAGINTVGLYNSGGCVNKIRFRPIWL